MENTAKNPNENIKKKILFQNRVRHLFNNCLINTERTNFGDYYRNKFEVSNNVKFFIRYINKNNKIEEDYIYPNTLHTFGFMLFEEGYLNVLGFSVKIKGFKRLSKDESLLLNIKFSKNHFGNNLISPIWNIPNNKTLNDYTYYLQFYQTFDNELVYQMSSKSGHLVGKLDPLKRKFDSNHFKNFLQIEEELIIKLKKMSFCFCDC